MTAQQWWDETNVENKGSIQDGTCIHGAWSMEHEAAMGEKQKRMKTMSTDAMTDAVFAMPRQQPAAVPPSSPSEGDGIVASCWLVLQAM